MSFRYGVTFKPFTKRYFVKKIIKKHSPKQWGLTKTAITALCANIEVTHQTGKLDIIVHSENLLICKLDFAIAGVKKSPKSGGGRCIIAQNTKKKTVSILLVYTKADIVGSKETVWWKNMIKENYPEYKEHL